MTAIKPDATARIRHLNDILRTTGQGGTAMLTSGVNALPPADRQAVVTAVRGFADFTPDNDPYGEHDCATVQVGEQGIIWKIDYYDVNLEFGSPDPADDTVTCRVLTIMIPSDL